MSVEGFTSELARQLVEQENRQLYEVAAVMRDFVDEKVSLDALEPLAARFEFASAEEMVAWVMREALERSFALLDGDQFSGPEREEFFRMLRFLSGLVLRSSGYR
jgi:hypothetical protein